MSASNEILTPSAVCTVETHVGTTLTRTIKAFVVLAKPEITMMVMISTGVASLLASGSVKIVVLFHAVFGTGLLAAGAASLNQYFERDLDSSMRRTARRPLPAGELLPGQALVFGVAVSVSGMLYVVFTLNALTALLGLLTLISYLFIYTPLKTKTRLSTFIGAFPGAAPVLMGWSAATNGLSLEAWALYAILFLWQFPHFYAIGWLYREDYARAGMFMLPENEGRNTFRFILISTQLLIIASLLFTFFAHSGRFYVASAIVLGICFYHFAYQLSLSRSNRAAKRLLHASVIYLPLLYMCILMDRINL
ncbi:MAG TPA: heme o synthase [Pyrinomonadaceae bacterium]|jgi:protoheme IX farnesyltransferase